MIHDGCGARARLQLRPHAEQHVQEGTASESAPRWGRSSAQCSGHRDVPESDTTIRESVNRYRSSKAGGWLDSNADRQHLASPSGRRADATRGQSRASSHRVYRWVQPERGAVSPESIFDDADDYYTGPRLMIGPSNKLRPRWACSCLGATSQR